MTDGARTAEFAARASYGRLVAMLASRSQDIAAAEDALAEAFRAALEVWPARGVPDNPEGWLVTAARRNLSHGYRHSKTRENAIPTIELLTDERADEVADFPDNRLKLMFICAHPAIDEAVRTPLMLQTILGLDATRIAAAFLLSPAAISQRLVRAKAKIRDAGIAFAVPERAEMRERLGGVLSAVYAAYGAAYDDPAAVANRVDCLSGEAIYLGRLIVSLLPDEPEPRGLLALMLYCEARAAARRDADGAFVPLATQNHGLWSRDLIIEAENHLATAARRAQFGRFQTEAAIQSVHVQRALTGVTNHRALIALYDLLAAQEPSIGALVSRAAVYGESGRPAEGLAMLDALDAKRVNDYQPYWAARAQLLAWLGLKADANAAFDRAIALSNDAAVQLFLQKRKQTL